MFSVQTFAARLGPACLQYTLLRSTIAYNYGVAKPRAMAWRAINILDLASYMIMYTLEGKTIIIKLL